MGGPMTIKQAFQLVGASADVATRFAHILGLDPSKVSEHLSPGKIQLLAIGRALLRDPEVIVMARPLAYIPPAAQLRIACLLRLWQACGGMKPLLARLGAHLELHDDLKKADTTSYSLE